MPLEIVENDRSRERALLCLVFAILWLYLARDLSGLTMGLDGVVYAGIANFLAAGEGGFWAPPTFESGVEFFHDHPPLGVWLQSLWFRVAGDAFWVERVFSGAVILATAGVIALLWRGAIGARSAEGEDAGSKAGAWWPLLLFFVMPVTTYALKNNTLDSLLGLVSLLGVYAAWLGRQNSKMNLLVGIACLAGFLIKGPVALFVLAAPGCFALIIDGSLRSAIKNSLLAGGVFSALLFVLVLVEPAGVFFQRYYQSQILASLSGVRNIEHGRWYQLGQMSMNLSVAGIVAVAGWALQRSLHVSREFWSFILLGVCATLPLLISPRQYKHYLLPGLPYFAIGIALLVAPKSPNWRVIVIWLLVGVVGLAGVARATYYWGEPGNDEAELADAELIAQTIAPARTVRFCSNPLEVRTYLARFHAVRSGSTLVGSDDEYLVCMIDEVPPGYSRSANLSDGQSVWHRNR